jgi:hypothetical protein
MVQQRKIKSKQNSNYPMKIILLEIVDLSILDIRRPKNKIKVF